MGHAPGIDLLHRIEEEQHPPELDFATVRRALPEATVGEHPRFIEMMAELIRERLLN